MRIYAIGDLHLSMSEAVDKPMDMFGPEWENHAERLEENWLKNVEKDDIVIVCGDVSWALKLEDAMTDLDWLHGMPGRKVFFKGNHDLWWQSTNKMNALYDDGTMIFVQNHCLLLYGEAQGFEPTECCETDKSGRFADRYETCAHCEKDCAPDRQQERPRLAICGTRGWMCPGIDGFTAHDRKIYERETLRLRMSLEEAKSSGAEILIGVLHFPPTNDKQQPSEFTRLMSEYGVKTCVYGHLHGKEVHKTGIKGIFNCVEYKLVSFDYTGGNLMEVLK